jgi:hypothetical protein
MERIGGGGIVYWNGTVENMDKCRTLVIAVMNLRVP